MTILQRVCAVTWVVVLGTAPTNAWSAEQLPPDQLVRQTAERVLQIIRADPEIAAGNTKHIAAVVEKELVEHFDFERMTRLAVGKNWNGLNATQKRALVKEFRELLVRTYSVALSGYRDQVIKYKPLVVEPGARTVVVQTVITQPGSKPVAMDYRMVATKKGWKVYDVIVESVSLVINYRSQFNSTMESSGIDGLIRLLHDKNAAAK